MRANRRDVLETRLEKLWKDLGKITAEYDPLASAQVRLSTE